MHTGDYGGPLVIIIDIIIVIVIVIIFIIISVIIIDVLIVVIIVIIVAIIVTIIVIIVIIVLISCGVSTVNCRRNLTSDRLHPFPHIQCWVNRAGRKPNKNKSRLNIESGERGKGLQ